MGVSNLIVALHADDWKTQVEAARQLGELGDIRALPALAEALYASDTAVIRASAQALLKLRQRSAVEALLQACADEDSSVAEEVQSVLEEADSWFVTATMSTLLESADGGLRKAAAEVLAYPLQTREALPALRTAASGDPNACVRAAAEASLAWWSVRDLD